MWPFDNILLNRIKDLEGKIEGYISANQVLSVQLQKAEDREAYLQTRLFEVSGITQIQNQQLVEVKQQQQPIKLHNKTSDWRGVRTNLEKFSEVEARRKYWEDKNKEESNKNKTEVAVDNLEKEVLKSEIN